MGLTNTECRRLRQQKLKIVCNIERINILISYCILLSYHNEHVLFLQTLTGVLLIQ